MGSSVTVVIAVAVAVAAAIFFFFSFYLNWSGGGLLMRIFAGRDTWRETKGFSLKRGE